MAQLRETDLYPPVKALLEAQGYTVKAEIGAADVVAVRGDEPPVIVELKTGFSLTLLHQAVERLRLTDAVYVAVPRPNGRARAGAFSANQALCRRLGLGLITVRLEDGVTEVHLDPSAPLPRKSPALRARLLREFHRRVGDPNVGGMTKSTIMTAYRQDALRCLGALGGQGPLKAAALAKQSGVSRARSIVADDHYGWFERLARGVYGLSPQGQAALSAHINDIQALMARSAAPAP